MYVEKEKKTTFSKQQFSNTKEFCTLFFIPMSKLLKQRPLAFCCLLTMYTITGGNSKSFTK